MSEIIGTFELDHICNTFTTDENNMITNHTNWRGTAEGFGAVFGTLTFSPTHLSEMDEKLKDDSNYRGLTISANVTRILYEYFQSEPIRNNIKLPVKQK